MMWIMEQIMTDEKFASHVESKDFFGFMHLAEQHKWNSHWRMLYRELSKQKYLFFTQTHVYYVKKEEQTLNLMRAPYDSSLSTFVSLVEYDEAEVIQEGVKPSIQYDRQNQMFYIPFAEMDVFVCYNLKEDTKRAVYGRLLGVSPTGRAWWIDLDGFLNTGICDKGIQQFQGVENCNFTVRKDGSLLVCPSKYESETVMPYILLPNGEYTTCDTEEAAQYLWKHLIDDISADPTLRYPCGLEEVLLADEVYKAPYPFTAKEIQEKLEDLAQRVLIKKGRLFPICDLLKLLVKKGIDRKEDITILMYTFWHYQKLCVRGYESLGMFHKVFYFMAYKLSKREDFVELLKENPKELFQEYI